MDQVVCMLLYKARAVHLKVLEVSDSKRVDWLTGNCIRPLHHHTTKMNKWWNKQ
jgi:hypothetical protein